MTLPDHSSSAATDGPETLTAAILAGGLGTRLRSVVRDQPKVLAEVRGRPFIEYLLDQLEREGLGSVVLCTGHLGDQVEARLGTSYGRMRLLYSREQAPLGTGGALRLALPLITSHHLLVLNGDSYCDASLAPFATWHRTRAARASLVLTEEQDTRRYGRVEVDEAGHILGFHEKSAADGPGWINAGIYLLPRDLIESIPTDRPVSIEREVFPGLIGNGLFGYRSQGTMWDIGIPEAYELANQGQVALFSKPD